MGSRSEPLKGRFHIEFERIKRGIGKGAGTTVVEGTEMMSSKTSLKGRREIRGEGR